MLDGKSRRRDSGRRCLEWLASNFKPVRYGTRTQAPFNWLLMTADWLFTWTNLIQYKQQLQLRVCRCGRGRIVMIVVAVASQSTRG